METMLALIIIGAIRLAVPFGLLVLFGTLVQRRAGQRRLMM